MILGCYLTELFLTLYGNNPLETLSNKGRIHSEACRQIHKKGSFPSNTSLISGRLFAGTLLHREMRGIDDAFPGSPRGDLGTGFLTPGNLFQGNHQVYLGILRLPKCQLTDISLSMLTDKVERRLIHGPVVLSSSRQPTTKRGHKTLQQQIQPYAHKGRDKGNGQIKQQ